MLWRALGIVALAAVLGLGGGWAVAALTDDPAASTGAAAPVPATSPSLPVPTVAPYAEDVDFPTLLPGLTYVPRVVGQPPFTWSYRSPEGWLSSQIGPSEVRWTPPENPDGGYGLRVKVVNAGLTPEQMVEQKLAALEAGYADVTVVGRSSDTLAITFRSEEQNWLRYNTFRWFTPDDSDLAIFETSVSGREEDLRGLVDLLDQVSASVAEVEDP